MNLSVYFVTPDSPTDALVAAAVRGGATIVQLRDKTASSDAMTEQALRLKPICAEFGVPLIINDRLDVAIRSEADGLHIGQSDGNPLDMRLALGPEKILGLSIEEKSQMQALARLPIGIVDYIGVGPIRPTKTKKDHSKPIGFDMLGRICQTSPIPAVAIGGVARVDIPALKRAHCKGLAVVSAIAGSDDPEEATRQLVLAWRNA